MRDPRIDKLATQVIENAVTLQRGEKLLIDIWDGAEDFAIALVVAAQKAGGMPYVSLQSMSINRAYMLGLTDEAMQGWFDFEYNRMKEMDAYIAIRRQENIHAYADVPEEKRALYNRYYAKLHSGKRITNTKWCVLRYPNDSMAQLAGMSKEQFEELYFNACCMDYKKLNVIAGALSRLAFRTDKVRIVAPGTDLCFSIKGQCQEKSYCGRWNLPCGETGMTVVQGSANGTIRYNFPSSYQGRLFTDVCLTLQNGVVIDATANHSALLNQILDNDTNARRIGEFAIGFNPLITQPITDTLFDEKATGTLHFTPGNGSNNPSAIHWDLVQSHLPAFGGGEIWFDDVLIRKDGQFVLPELLMLNPDNLLANLVAPT